MVIQLVLLYVFHSLVEALGTYHVISTKQKEDAILDLTSKAQIRQGLLIPPQMVVYTEALVVVVQCAEFSEEGEILSWVLEPCKHLTLSVMHGGCKSHFLRMLGDH